MKKCPNCGYERQSKDDEYGIMSILECPRCHILYDKWTPSNLAGYGKPKDTAISSQDNDGTESLLSPLERPPNPAGLIFGGLLSLGLGCLFFITGLYLLVKILELACQNLDLLADMSFEDVLVFSFVLFVVVLGMILILLGIKFLRRRVEGLSIASPIMASIGLLFIVSSIMGLNFASSEGGNLRYLGVGFVFGGSCLYVAYKKWRHNKPRGGDGAGKGYNS